VNLIDHLDQDHILFAGGGGPNFLVLVYLVEKVQEGGTWRGVSQVSLIDMWEACDCVASGSVEQGGACWHQNWGQAGGAVLSGGAPSTRGWWGGVGCFAFPLTRRREPKGGTEGSRWYSCNLTGHVTRKSRDSVRGVSESANCTWRENRGVQSLLFITKLANGATTYPGLHDHTAVCSK